MKRLVCLLVAHDAIQVYCPKHNKVEWHCLRCHKQPITRGWVRF